MTRSRDLNNAVMFFICVLLGYLCVDTWKMSMLEVADIELHVVSKKMDYVNCRDDLAKRRLRLSVRHSVSTDALPHDDPCEEFEKFLERNDFEIAYLVYNEHVVSIESEAEIFMRFSDWTSYLIWFRYMLALMFVVSLLAFVVQIRRGFTK